MSQRTPPLASTACEARQPVAVKGLMVLTYGIKQAKEEVLWDRGIEDVRTTFEVVPNRVTTPLLTNKTQAPQ